MTKQNQPTPGEQAVWVRTQIGPDGDYQVQIEYDPMHSETFTEQQARDYAQCVLAETARVEYDAAVMRQMTAIVDEGSAIAFVVDLRKTREPISWPTNVELTGGVAKDPGPEFRPFVVIKHNDQAVGQWAVSSAREHAMHVLDALIVTGLNANYRKGLIELADIDADTATAAVGGLGEFR